MYRAELGCLEGCEGVRFALDEPVYRCPRCGGLLDVVHDLAALRDRSAETWWRLFDQRLTHSVPPLSSGVWGKHEWIAPELPLDAAPAVTVIHGTFDAAVQAQSLRVVTVTLRSPPPNGRPTAAGEIV